jgi:hypothetical protein
MAFLLLGGHSAIDDAQHDRPHHAFRLKSKQRSF